MRRIEVDPAVVARARAGDADSLNTVLEATQDLAYALALRTLWHPHDAQDCAQDILISVARGLRGFRGDSSLTTWVMAISMREIARHATRAARRPVPVDDLLLAEPDPGAGPEEELLGPEVELICAAGIISRLSVPLRLAYVLGDVAELTDVTGAEILGISAAAFRQRLVRARRILRADVDARLGDGGRPPLDPRSADRIGRAAEELARLAESSPPVDLSTPDLVGLLCAAHPALLSELQRGSPEPPGALARSA